MNEFYSCFLLVELTDILYVLTYLKTPDDQPTTKRIHFILETNKSLRTLVNKRLTEKNSEIIPDEFPLIRDILFNYHNGYILHGIDQQQYLSRMLTHQNKTNLDYLLAWFQCFLCDSNPHWMNYQSLLGQWTECFVYKQDSFSRMIEQIDMLIEIWTRVAPQDQQRVDFFIEHMVSQCFRQGKKRV